MGSPIPALASLPRHRLLQQLEAGPGGQLCQKQRQKLPQLQQQQLQQQPIPEAGLLL